MDKSEENKKPIKNRKRFAKILNIIIIVVAVVLLVVEGFLFYQRSYLTPFWVNGQSMYPTLNEHATDAYGYELGEGGGGAQPGAVGRSLQDGGALRRGDRGEVRDEHGEGVCARPSARHRTAVRQEASWACVRRLHLHDVARL